ncbi:MAG: hypothetical protein KJO11_05040 [Gemmatimonadetes bacterium]|nr:hypothetical protein [Gemmatimonadota bacterium]MBT8402990.1 hypothetical protein [Gemmatimonadota bacterium]NNF39337.1 hypothetical protein [Gemmatimonadota bacterium]
MSVAPDIGPPPSLPDAASAPWVETRPGAVFFINALAAAPVFVALYPWAVRWLLRTAGILDRPSRILDPVPAVAAHFAPVVGWLALPALAFAIYGFRIADRRWARVLLGIFAVAHVGTVIYTAAQWVG